jgi:hypothetical protein
MNDVQSQVRLPTLLRLTSLAVGAAFLAFGSQPASAQTNLSSYVGAGGPYAAEIHWLDFTPVAPGLRPIDNTTPNAQAIAATLGAVGTLVSGSVSTAQTVTSGTGYLYPRAVPTYSQAIFGNTTTGFYTGISAPVALYTTPAVYTGSTSVTLSNPIVKGTDGRRWQAYVVLADAESTGPVGEEVTATGSPTAPEAMPGTPLTYGTWQPAKVFQALNPTTATITAQSTGGKEGFAIGVRPLTPKVVITCDAATSPAATQANCTVTVSNPPLEAFTITPSPSDATNLDSTSSCLNSIAFAAPSVTTSGTPPDVQQTCVIKAAAGKAAPGAITLTPTSTDSGKNGVSGWVVVPGTPTLGAALAVTGVSGATGVAAVPVDSGWMLLLASLGILGAAGLRRKQA